MFKLYLIPSGIGEAPLTGVLPLEITRIINEIDYFIVENERTARRFLIKAGIKKPIDSLTFFVLNEHTRQEELENFLRPAENNNIGLISEAGVPCIADPGAVIVKKAHEKGIRVVPLVGPSSILLAMMASGLNGQNFAFNGYLPVKQPDRNNKIKQLEKRSKQENQSQIFIEAPYRNNQLLKDIILSCQPETHLCLAADITEENEMIITKQIKEWAKKTPELHKRPVIFILQGK